MAVMFPPALKARLEALAAGRPRALLHAKSRSISEAYRKGQGSSLVIRDADDALAYALARMPATFAAVAMAFQRLQEAMPDLAPTSLLDLASGPGTATFAAQESFSTLQSITAIDACAPFRALAERLMEARGVATRAGDIADDPLSDEPADLVVVAYALVELDAERRRRVIARAASAMRQALVLVEPGTPTGFDHLRDARNQLIAQGFHMVAPCPHAGPCPMAGADWCHVTARLPRSRDHLRLKAAAVPFEDEPFAYLCVTRQPPAVRAPARIIAPVRITKIDVTTRVCADDGLRAVSVSRRDRSGFAAARRLTWGDSWHVPGAGEAP